MRCSLGARRGKRNAGEGICHGAGDVGAWGRFFGHDGPEGDGFPADTMGRRGDGFPAAFPALEAWATGVFVFPGAFPSVMREGGAGAEGVVSTRRAGTGRYHQVASGAAAFFRVDEDRRSDRGVFPRRHAGRGVSAEGVVGRWAALPLRAARGRGDGVAGRFSPYASRGEDARFVMRKGRPHVYGEAFLPLRAARGRGGAVRSRQERRRFFGLMETDALTGAFFLGVTREGESVRRASSGDGRRCLCAPRGDGAMAWRGGFLHTLRGVKMPGL